MAANLVLRVCQVDEADGGLPNARVSPDDPSYDPTTAHIAFSDFCRGLHDILLGAHTGIQIKGFLSMDITQEGEFDTLWAQVIADDPGGGASDSFLQAKRIDRIESILSKWERRDYLSLAGYDTPDEVQAHIMAVSTLGY